MVRIAHISDSHLGCSLFELAERREDARKCLKKAVDMAMRQSPDILAHTGDLFHSPQPSMDDLNFAVDLFNGIKDKVMAIVLQGNHDIPYGFRHDQSPVLTIQNAGLVESTGQKSYASKTYDFDGQKVDIHLVSWAREHDLARIIGSIHPSSNASILLAHDLPKNRDLIPNHFDYVGFGHAHNFWLDKERSYGRPGSTCFVDWKKERGGEKKLIVVDVSSNGVQYATETLNDVREFKFVPDLDITGMGPKEVQELVQKSLNSLVSKKSGQPIVIMEVRGTVDRETENAIKRTEILRYGDKLLKPLFFHIEVSWQSSGPGRVRLTQPLNVRSSVQQYVQQTGEGNIEELTDALDALGGTE
jgi:DNA repair exonuclease SbcCD nuclease subunit